MAGLWGALSALPFDPSPQPAALRAWTPRKPEAAARPEEALGALLQPPYPLFTSPLLVSVLFGFLYWTMRYLVGRAQARLDPFHPFPGL